MYRNVQLDDLIKNAWEFDGKHVRVKGVPESSKYDGSWAKMKGYREQNVVVKVMPGDIEKLKRCEKLKLPLTVEGIYIIERSIGIVPILRTLYANKAYVDIEDVKRNIGRN